MFRQDAAAVVDCNPHVAFAIIFTPFMTLMEAWGWVGRVCIHQVLITL